MDTDDIKIRLEEGHLIIQVRLTPGGRLPDLTYFWVLRKEINRLLRLAQPQDIPADQPPG